MWPFIFHGIGRKDPRDPITSMFLKQDATRNTHREMTHAFITWDAALGRRMCPLATFGSRAPLVHRARLVCVDPPRADHATLRNADAVRGAIALVVRGGCSFLDKARRIQEAGAVAMILANNTREEPFTMFTMAADAACDAEPTIEETEDDGSITIPCVMMCLYDVRELFKQFPPSVQTGVLTFEIQAPTRERELVAECEATRLLAMQQHARDGHATAALDEGNGGRGGGGGGGGGWGAALKRKTSSLIRRWEAPTAAAESPRAATYSAGASSTSGNDSPRASTQPPLPPPSPPTSVITTTTVPATVSTRVTVDLEPKHPVFAFVQWAISASEYVLFFAPLSDFCLVANHAVYEGRRVVCDPPLCHEDVIRNGAELVDAIALVQRGACTFPAKLERIQRCGAAAAIVGNDDTMHDDAAFVMSVDHIKVDHVTIPAVMVSYRVFQRLVEVDCPTQLRILCLSGEAAAECLTRAGGQPIPIREIPTPEKQTNEQDDPVARLHAACRASDHGACKRVLDECCADDRARRELVLARDPFQLSALHHACAASNSAHHAAGADHIVALLLRLGAQANARDAALNSPLHFACLHGHAACVKRLLAASITSQELAAARNLGGATPIHYAAMAGSTACVELLLSANARRVDGDKYCFDGVDAQDEDGATPLHVASAATHVDCVLYLVAANANLSVRDRHGRTALQIACTQVNEPSQSLQALLIVEKLMDAGAPVVVGDEEAEGDANAPLAIDCVASKAIKRELEIAFLRREAHQSRAQFRGLTQQLKTQNHHLKELQNAFTTVEQRHKTAQRVASEQERRLTQQQRQIDQLQLQMKTLLTVLHSGSNAGVTGAASTVISTHVLADAATATRPGEYDYDDDGDNAVTTETARALDAALARDLGKKCCRERQFALAQTYFERSLDVFPLPGVARLLSETKGLRQAAEARGTPIDSSTMCTHATTNSGHGDERDEQRLRRIISGLTASQPTKAALTREIEKLEAMDRRSGDYGASLKWIEWLLALPWDSTLNDGEEGNATAPHVCLLALEAAMFDEIERMENERLGRQQHDAARTIQGAFRERYAVHLLRRAMASAQIQRVYKRHRQRREQQRQATLAITRHRQRGVGENHNGSTERDEHEQDGTAEVLPNKQAFEDGGELDVAATVDARGQHHRMRVIRGERVESAAQYAVLQLLATDPVVQRSFTGFQKNQPDAPVHFHVWKRWGATKEDARQTTLCGPYEELETATVRYERLLRESQLATTPETKRDDATSKMQALPAEATTTTTTTTTAWTWLRASSS